MARTKKKTPNHHPETVEKEISSLLLQMQMKDSPEVADKWLEFIGIIIYAFINEVYLQGEDAIHVLESFIEVNKADKGASLFSVSATTLNNDLKQFPRSDADHLLSQQITQIEGKLRKEGLWTSDQLIAIDSSDVIYRGKYRNQYTPVAYCGQKMLYKRAFEESTIYSNPGALIVSSTQMIVQSPDRCERELPQWLSQAQALIMEERSRGTFLKLIEGDRAYYVALGFAFSRFGLWDVLHSLHENPRFLVPMKIWDDSTDKKWTYLLNSSAPVIEESEISIDFYQEKFLGPSLALLPSNEKGTKHMVPTATVAIFDSYSNRHSCLTLDQAHEQAKKIKQKLDTLPSDLKEAEKDYIEYLTEKEKYKKKNQKRPSSTRKIASPTYTGKRRTVFKDSEERKLYRHCCDIYDRIQYWEEQKTKLCKRLMFFMLSLYEDETILGKEEEFTKLVKEYHERWAIEISF
jgi:hypothetical protein